MTRKRKSKEKWPWTGYRELLRSSALQHRKGAFKLHGFQEEAVAAVEQEWAAGNTGAIVSHPMGTGKTEVAVALIQRMGGQRVLFLVHLRHLVLQASDRVGLRAPELAADVGRVMRGYADDDARILVGTLQTLTRKNLARLKDIVTQFGPFDLVCFDEAHHMAARTFAAAVEYLMKVNPNVRFVCLTATPFRGDGRQLPQALGTVVSKRTIRWSIDHGYLVPVRGMMVRTDLDLSDVRMRGGDYERASLRNAIDTPARNKLIVRIYKDVGWRRRFLVFCNCKAHARHVLEEFLAAKVPAEMIIDTTSDKKRQEILARFVAGETWVIVNIAVLSEGFDCPCVSGLIMARPTKSPVLYVQTVGRALRLSPGKTHAVVVDMTDRGECVGLDDMIGAGSYQAVKVARVTGRGQGMPRLVNDPTFVPPAEDVEARVEVVDLLGRTPWAWYSAGGRSTLVLAEGVYAALLPPLGERARERLEALEGLGPDLDLARRWRVAHADRYVLYRVEGGKAEPCDWDTSYDLALSAATAWVDDNANAALAQRQRQWRGRPASPRQVAALVGRGVLLGDRWLAEIEAEVGHRLPRGLASDLLTHREALATISGSGFDPYSTGRVSPTYAAARLRELLKERGTTAPRVRIGAGFSETQRRRARPVAAAG